MKRSLFIAIALSCLPLNLHAREYMGLGPLSLRNQNPVYLQTLAMTPVRACVLAKGTIEARIDSSYSNVFEEGISDTANVDMDMEVWRLAPHVLYGLTDDLEIGIEIPLIHFSGGFLDGFVQGFHKTFGLPNAGRDQYPDDRFSYRLDDQSGTIVNYPPATLGLGDVSFHLKHQLTGEDSDWPAIAWFADLKLPTGRKGRGFGNGSPDFGLGGALDVSWRRLHGYFNAGYYVTGRNEDIEKYMHGEIFAYMVAGEVTILPGWSLVVQFNGSTPLLTGAQVGTWDGVPLDFIVGFRGEEQKLIGGQDFFWQVGFSEDITSRGPSVDFTAFASIGVRLDIFGRSRPSGEWMAGR